MKFFGFVDIGLTVLIYVICFILSWSVVTLAYWNWFLSDFFDKIDYGQAIGITLVALAISALWGLNMENEEAKNHPGMLVLSRLILVPLFMLGIGFIFSLFVL